ncbi:MAG: hypothetical protein Q9207_004653 [Kuettlingeria erythrocarpa]
MPHARLQATDVDQYDGTLATDYDEKVTPDVTPEGNAFKDLFQNQLHFDFNKHFTTHVVSERDNGVVAYVNMFNTNEGTLVNDCLQCYKKECDEIQELKNFQFAGVTNIANQEHLGVIEDLYKRNNLPLYGPRTDKWIQWTYEEKRDDFLAFLGTPKISYILRMLADHSNAFDKRIPTEVRTNKWRNTIYVIIDEYKK